MCRTNSQACVSDQLDLYLSLLKHNYTSIHNILILLYQTENKSQVFVRKISTAQV